MSGHYDLDRPLNASRGLSAIAEFFVELAIHCYQKSSHAANML